MAGYFIQDTITSRHSLSLVHSQKETEENTNICKLHEYNFIFQIILFLLFQGSKEIVIVFITQCGWSPTLGESHCFSNWKFEQNFWLHEAYFLAGIQIKQ